MEDIMTDENLNRCPQCTELVRGRDKYCRACGRQFGDSPVSKSRGRETYILSGLIVLVVLVFLGFNIDRFEKKTEPPFQHPDISSFTPEMSGMMDSLPDDYDRLVERGNSLMDMGM